MADEKKTEEAVDAKTFVLRSRTFNDLFNEAEDVLVQLKEAFEEVQAKKQMPKGKLSGQFGLLINKLHSTILDVRYFQRNIQSKRPWR
jgi:hypothetical protein